MAKIQIVYDASEEVEKVIKLSEERLEMKKDEKDVFDAIQNLFQSAFNEGRKFQKQLSLSSPVKDGILTKSDI